MQKNILTYPRLDMLRLKGVLCMNIVVVNGSPRRKDSFRVINKILEQMKEREKTDIEFINLKELDVKECIGCMLCFEKGEQLCPLKDDVLKIKEKLIVADGIIFASPVYACHVTGTMKKAVDRMSFMFHRPELVGKAAINVVTTGGGGQKPTQKYLKLIASGWGCNLVGMLSVMSPLYFEDSDYYNVKYSNRIDKQIEKLTDKFIDSIRSTKKPTPTFYDLFMFHGLKSKALMFKPDYEFWQARGWLKSSYYYDTRLNPFKRLFGLTMDYIISIVSKKFFKKKEIQKA